jgi:hypothetical protein
MDKGFPSFPNQKTGRSQSRINRITGREEYLPCPFVAGFSDRAPSRQGLQTSLQEGMGRTRSAVRSESYPSACVQTSLGTSSHSSACPRCRIQSHIESHSCSRSSSLAVLAESVWRGRELSLLGRVYGRVADIGHHALCEMGYLR